MSLLLDTNVLSELRKGPSANARVRAWFSGVSAEELYLSVLVVGGGPVGLVAALTLARAGVRKLVIVSSHGGNSAAMSLVAQELRARAGQLGTRGLRWYDDVGDLRAELYLDQNGQLNLSGLVISAGQAAAGTPSSARSSPRPPTTKSSPSSLPTPHPGSGRCLPPVPL